MRLPYILLGVFAAACSHADQLALKTALHHPIKYLISLPEGWKENQSYRTLIVIPGAERNFKEFAQQFVDARGSKPIIIVAPMVTTDGGASFKDAPDYQYSPETWAQIDKDRWKFDHDGILAVADDVGKLYGGRKRFAMTGLEAAGHTLFAFVFSEPQRVEAVALAAPNYAGRYVAAPSSKASYRIPIHAFVGELDNLWNPNVLQGQWDQAAAEARRRGFQDLKVHTVPGRKHEALADVILPWIEALPD